jgi:hypothetical protein
MPGGALRLAHAVPRVTFGAAAGLFAAAAAAPVLQTFPVFATVPHQFVLGLGGAAGAALSKSLEVALASVFARRARATAMFYLDLTELRFLLETRMIDIHTYHAQKDKLIDKYFSLQLKQF